MNGKIGSWGQWIRKPIRGGIEFAKRGTIGEQLFIQVFDLEWLDNSKDPQDWDKLPDRLRGKNGFMVDAEFFLEPAAHSLLFWHHEKRFTDQSTAMTYAQKVMDFADKHSVEELAAKKKSGKLGFSRLESKIPPMTEVFVFRD